MTISVSLIGLGRIAESHVRALEQLDGVELVAGCDVASDRDLTFRGVPLPVRAAVADLEPDQPEVVVVATPTPEHARVCAEVLAWRRPPARLLVEKPAASALDDVNAMFAAAAGRVRVDVLYHAAHAPEVEWAAARMRDWSAEHGPVVGYDSFFSDPYAGAEQWTPESGLVSSWLDSGVNALSVSRRLVRPTRLVSLSLLDRQGSAYEATILFGGLGAKAPGEEVAGRIRTTWDVPAPAKWTTVAFASGAVLRLDHQRVAGSFAHAHHDEEAFAYRGPHTRLVSHYLGVYSSLLLGEGEALGQDDSLLLHRLLFSPVHDSDTSPASRTR